MEAIDSNSNEATVAVAPIDDLDYESDEEDVEFRNQVSELGKSVFQMTVDDDQMDIQSSESSNEWQLDPCPSGCKS